MDSTSQLRMERQALWLHRYAVLVAACTLVLIFAGGLVTSTGSGLAVPDWPLSYGQFFPPMVGGVFYEHGHRLIAASVGILTFILALWLWRSEPRQWVRKLGAIALLTVLVQGILGGITVLLLLPTPVSVTHAGLAQVFFCLVVSLALFTSPSWKTFQTWQPVEGDEAESSAGATRPGKLETSRSLATTTTAVIYLQIIIGAWMRHTGSGLAIPDFPLSYGRWIPPFFTGQIAIHFAHRIGALGVLVLVGWLCWRLLRYHRQDRALWLPGLTMLALTLLQGTLGALTIWSSRAVIPTTLHVAVGALTLASSLYLTLRLRRSATLQPAGTLTATSISGG